jgi:hypothetical protein
MYVDSLERNTVKVYFIYEHHSSSRPVSQPARIIYEANSIRACVCAKSVNFIAALLRHKNPLGEQHFSEKHIRKNYSPKTITA